MNPSVCISLEWLLLIVCKTCCVEFLNTIKLRQQTLSSNCGTDNVEKLCDLEGVEGIWLVDKLTHSCYAETV